MLQPSRDNFAYVGTMPFLQSRMVRTCFLHRYQCSATPCKRLPLAPVLMTTNVSDRRPRQPRSQQTCTCSKIGIHSLAYLEGEIGVYDNKAITQEMVQASIKLDVHSWWIARGLRVGDFVQSPPVV
jgi:hypothetical protein